jgi:dolichyl-phosphate-mannose--protein O-mannosyl transferase
MFRANKDIATPHQYQSYWYTWPIMQRPINCFHLFDKEIGKASRVYLLGNPLVWWFVLACVALSPLCFVLRRVRIRTSWNCENGHAKKIALPLRLFADIFSFYFFFLCPFRCSTCRSQQLPMTNPAMTARSLPSHQPLATAWYNCTLGIC